MAVPQKKAQLDKPGGVVGKCIPLHHYVTISFSYYVILYSIIKDKYFCRIIHSAVKYFFTTFALVFKPSALQCSKIAAATVPRS